MRQKINFVTHFFLKILQRNSKLVILGNLGMPGHTHLKYSINLRKHLTSIFRQRINFILHNFLELFFIAKILKTRFGYFGHDCTHSKVILSTYRKLTCLSAANKSTLSPMLFWRLVVSSKNQNQNSRTRILPNMTLVRKYQ